MLYAVIVAGGQGTRLWPASRKTAPKQLAPFAGGGSLIQRTYSRVSRIIPPQRIYVVTNEMYAEAFLQQIPELTSDRLILEPEPRSTAAAVGIGAAVISKIDPDATMVNVWADHYYDDEDGYLRIIKASEKLIEKYPDYLINNMLATPVYPSSAFDYFQIGNKLDEVDGVDLFEIKSFARKPDLETAKRYLAEGNYYWNTANFVWKVSTLLSMFQQYVPEMHQGLMSIASAWGTPEWPKAMREEFPKLPSDTIDYAILERTSKVILIPAQVGWKDVGNWQVVHEMLASIEGQSVISRGKVIALDSENSLIFNENPDKLVAVAGVDDLVIVDTADSLLVMKKSQDQQVKDVVSKIKEMGEQVYL